jgi:hypothetical protein
VLGWVVAASRKRGAFGKGGRVAGWPGSRVADLQAYHIGFFTAQCVLPADAKRSWPHKLCKPASLSCKASFEK